VGGGSAVTEPQEEDLSEGREGCAQSIRSAREGGPKRDQDFLTMPIVQLSDPRR